MGPVLQRWAAAALFSAAIALTGCVEQRGVQDLQEFTESAHKEPKPLVEPLPVIRPHESFVYTASDETDPFSRANLTQRRATPLGVSPDALRRREPLEQFPLDSLSFVGTMFREGTSWVIVRAPDGTVHSARPGNYLGQNSGSIQDITERQVAIKELVPGPTGDWEERMVNINVVQ